MYLKRGILILIVLLTLFTFYNNSSTKDITANVVEGGSCDVFPNEESAIKLKEAVEEIARKTNQIPEDILRKYLKEHSAWGEYIGCIDDYSLEETDDCWKINSYCDLGNCIVFDGDLQSSIAKLKEGRKNLKFQAFEILGRKSNPQTIKILLRYFLKENQELEIRKRAGYALYRLTNRISQINPEESEFDFLTSKMLLLLEESPHEEIRREAVRILGRTKKEIALPRILNSIREDPSEQIRSVAVSALAQFKPSRNMITTLREALKDGRDVRKLAIQMLAIKDPSEETLGIIEDVLKSDPEYIVRSYTITAIYSFGKTEETINLLYSTLMNDEDMRIKKDALSWILIWSKNEFKELGEHIAGLINEETSSEKIIDSALMITETIDEIHEYESEKWKTDDARDTIIQELNLDSIYYLFSLGGGVMFTSTFEKIYNTRLTPYPKEAIRGIDTQREYALGYILTLAKFNKLADIFVEDPDYFFDIIIPALQVKDEDRLRNNGMLLTSTIIKILEDPQLISFKPRLENFLIRQYYLNKDSNNKIGQAILGYIIKANKNSFEDERVDSISKELPEILTPTVPKEWFEKDSKITAKLFFTQAGQLDRTKESFKNNFGFMESNENILILDPRRDSIENGKNKRNKGKYNGIQLEIILTENLKELSSSVNDPNVDIISHRGHSFSERDKFIPKLPEKTEVKKLMFLGGCGGFGRVCSVQKRIPKGYYISDEGTGEGVHNDRVLFYLMRSIAIRKDNSKIFWSDIENDVVGGYTDKEISYETGIIFPHQKSLLLNPFIDEFIN